MVLSNYQIINFEKKYYRFFELFIHPFQERKNIECNERSISIFYDPSNRINLKQFKIVQINKL